jgi:drug/metabolite transporter (DMT)-like permease
MPAVVLDPRRNEALGGALIGLASVQFGLVVILGKLVARADISVFTMLAIRFGIAALALAVVLVALRQPLAAASGEGRWLVVLGVVGYAVEASLFFAALRHGQAAAVTLLFFTYPVFVALASMGLGRGTPGPLLGAALLCSVSGAALVITLSGRIVISPLGVILALLSAVSFTAYLLGADHVLQRTNSLTGSMWVAGSASIALVAYAGATGAVDAPPEAKQWFELAGMGLATSGAFVCLFAGLRRLGPVRTSIVAAAEPLATIVLAAVILGESVRPWMAAGGVLILAGAVTASLARAAPEAERQVP